MWISFRSASDLEPGATRIEPLELPDFAVITGLNGSGKTHLLRQIAEGKVGWSADRIEPMIVPAPVYSIHHEGSRYPRDPEDSGYGDPPGSIEYVAAGELQQALPWRRTSRPDELSLTTAIANARTETAAAGRAADREREFERQLKIAGIPTAGIAAARRESRVPLIDLPDDELRAALPQPVYFPSPFAGELLASLMEYRRRQAAMSIESALGGGRVTSARVAPVPARAEQQGPTPWESINDILAEIGVPVRILEPGLRFDEDQMSVEVTEPGIRRLDGVSGDGQSPLSTGETVLLRLAAAAFMARAYATGRTGLILLDEPDVFLHPSMIRTMMRVLQENVVAGMGVPVLLTTHSPSTAALAPEGSHFVSTAGERIRAVSRDSAVRALSEGVPILAVSVDARRTVVTEDKADESLHSMAYQALAGMIESEFTLQFLGIKGGRSVVERVVPDLRGSGNERVIGLVDFDDRPVTTPHIYAAEARYTMENYALDPLTVGLYVLAHEPAAPGASRPDARDYQAVVDWVHKESAPTAMRKSPEVECEYVGGFVLRVPKWFLEKGHVLEQILEARFSSIRAIKDRGVAIPFGLPDAIWPLNPLVIPMDLKRLYDRLSDPGLLTASGVSVS